jgi:hypothetical protein
VPPDQLFDLGPPIGLFAARRLLLGVGLAAQDGMAGTASESLA